MIVVRIGVLACVRRGAQRSAGEVVPAALAPVCNRCVWIEGNQGEVLRRKGEKQKGKVCQYAIINLIVAHVCGFKRSMKAWKMCVRGRGAGAGRDLKKKTYCRSLVFGQVQLIVVGNDILPQIHAFTCSYVSASEYQFSSAKSIGGTARGEL